jgi:hypothetical protein
VPYLAELCEQGKAEHKKSAVPLLPQLSQWRSIQVVLRFAAVTSA